ncbi:unnamed protein product [Amoebophrya sp. A120]|nr:unnamed protein product [Amoebophrya sp. A120]|eukprot:GSA120T00008203001.1
MASFLRQNVRLVGLQQLFLSNWSALFISTLLHDLTPTPDAHHVGGSMQHTSWTVQAVRVLSVSSEGGASSRSSSPTPSSVSTPRSDPGPPRYPARDEQNVASWFNLNMQMLQLQDDLADLQAQRQRARGTVDPNAAEAAALVQDPEETARQQQAAREREGELAWRMEGISEEMDALGFTPETRERLQATWDNALRRRRAAAAAARRFLPIADFLRQEVPADILP